MRRYHYYLHDSFKSCNKEMISNEELFFILFYFFFSIIREWIRVVRTDSWNFQSLHQAAREEDSLREF